MWEMFEAWLATSAPYVRPSAFGLVFATLVALHFAKWGIWRLNLVLGSAIFSSAIALSAWVVWLYAAGHARQISSLYGDNGSLVLYGIIWPLLLSICAATAIDLGWHSADRRDKSQS